MIQPGIDEPRYGIKAYPADAAKISCLLALVKSEIAAENRSVKTIIKRMVIGLVAMVPATASRYNSQTGTASSTRMTRVISIVTRMDTRCRVK